MKKTVLAVVGIVGFSGVLATQQAFAEDINVNYTSNGAITFEPDTDPTKPVNPTNPDEKVEPEDPTDPTGPKPGTAGPLSIDYASSFQFGAQKITSDTKDYYAQIQTFKDGTTGPNYVQVTDKRGTQEGWTLSAVQNGQFKTAQNEELVGAALSIANAGVTSIVDVAYAPTPTAAHTFVPGTEVELVKAEDGKGMGTWVYRFGKDATEGATAVKLNVPGKAIKLAKEYRTTLTWTLKSVPTNVGG